MTLEEITVVLWVVREAGWYGCMHLNLAAWDAALFTIGSGIK